MMKRLDSRMFEPVHKIWKAAFYAGESDDWLPYAEDLVRKWETQSCEEVKLSGFDLAIASMLLEDDLLPASARVAFSRLMLEVVREAKDKKLTLKCLGIKTPKPGRKTTDLRETGYRLCKVYQLINEEGYSPSSAYEMIAKECFKSTETIRREYERAMKKRKELNAGKSKGDFPGDVIT